jgi:hypothetical protein
LIHGGPGGLTPPRPFARFYTTFYLENYTSPMMAFRKRDDGSYDFPVPLVTDAPFAVFSVAEAGQWRWIAVNFGQVAD